MQLTSLALKEAMTALTDSGGVFDPTKLWIGVATAIVPNGINTALTAITPAPGTLAPLQEILSWGPAYLSKGNLETVDSGIHTFSPTTVADAALIVGWYLMDAASGGNLIAFGFLAVSAPLAGPQNVLSIVLRITVDPAGTWDVSQSWDD
ncbi:MAG: hypothetical protein ACRDQ6_05520 [Pseudonocardiaceae bacterium]